MRSSRSSRNAIESVPLDPGRHGFAHRGLHRWPELPENTLTAFAAALELGAGIECDLRLTADDRVAVFHDADGHRLCDRSERVIDTLAADLQRWTVAGKPIPMIEDLIRLVDGRVPLLLEAKVEGHDLWRMVHALHHALRHYRGPFGVMSFDPRIARWFKTNAPDWQRGLVLRADLPRWKRILALRLADPTFAAVDVRALAQPWVATLRSRIPVFSWTIRTQGDADEARRYADAAIWEAHGRP